MSLIIPELLSEYLHMKFKQHIDIDPEPKYSEVDMAIEWEDPRHVLDQPVIGFSYFDFWYYCQVATENKYSQSKFA